MNAVLQPKPTKFVEFQTLDDAWLERVLAVEQSAYPHPWSRANFMDSMATGYQMQVLCSAQADLIGYFVAMKGYEEVHLLNITVAPAYQGCGWSKALLDALAVWSRGQGATDLWLEVRASNARALKIYQAHGFDTISVRKDYYPATQCAREDAVVMNLKL